MPSLRKLPSRAMARSPTQRCSARPEPSSVPRRVICGRRDQPAVLVVVVAAMTHGARQRGRSQVLAAQAIERQHRAGHCHTPAFCHLARRRQQVTPEPVAQSSSRR